jgi:hypothetical protein
LTIPANVCYIQSTRGESLKRRPIQTSHKIYLTNTQIKAAHTGIALDEAAGAGKAAKLAGKVIVV